MPKLPRDLSGRQVGKALERLGFEFVHQRGSHLRYRKGSRRTTVPDYSSLPVGIVKSILQQADVSLDDLLKHL